MLIELGRSIAATSPGGFWIFVSILALCAPLTFWLAFSRLRESRLIQDTPTSRVRSAAQGYVEFEGFARLMPGPPIFSPLSRTRCAWWRYVIEHRERSGPSGRPRRSEERRVGKGWVSTCSSRGAADR